LVCQEGRKPSQSRHDQNGQCIDVKNHFLFLLKDFIKFF